MSSASREQPPDRKLPPGRRQKGPFVDSCEPGKYAWCACGRSATYPYCDGTHRDSGVTPIKIVIDKPTCVVWCACGLSNNKPFCDGSHSRL
jgi:CDGSH iron-sulfur domain-containing protein 3